MNTNDTENAMNDLTKAICRVKHAAGELDRCMARYKASLDNIICSAADRRNASSVEESVSVKFYGEDHMANLKYPDGESPSKNTRESKDE